MFEWSTLAEQTPADAATAWQGLDERLASMFWTEDSKPTCLQAYDIAYRFMLVAMHVPSTFSPLGKKLIKIYNEIFAEGYPGLSFDAISEYFQTHPFEEKIGVIKDILFDRNGWSVAYQEMRLLSNDLCY